MNNNDYIKIMKFFPPVNNGILNPIDETVSSYTNKYIFPLKKLPDGLMYSLEVYYYLKMLREVLNSNIESERLIYELNKLVSAWGPGGVYNENILNSALLDAINIINIKNIKNIKMLEFIEESKQVVYKKQLEDLENELGDISINFKNKERKRPSRKRDDDDFGFSRLSINKGKNKETNESNDIINLKSISKSISKSVSKSISKKKY